MRSTLCNPNDMSLRTFQGAPIPVTSASLHGAEVRKRLDRMLVARRKCIRYGWGMPATPTMEAAMGRLRNWLEWNPTPSAQTLRLLWSKHELDIRLVATTNAAGAFSLKRLVTILSAL